MPTLHFGSTVWPASGAAAAPVRSCCPATPTTACWWRRSSIATDRRCRPAGDCPRRPSRSSAPGSPPAPRPSRRVPIGDYWQLARSTVTDVPAAAMIPRSTPPVQELERTMALVDDAQLVGPAKTFPSADSISAPCPGDIATQSPVRSGLDPFAACSWLSPGSPAVPRSIIVRSFEAGLASDDVTSRPLSLLLSNTLPRILTFSPPNSWTPCLTLPQATRPLTVDTGAAPAV